MVSVFIYSAVIRPFVSFNVKIVNTNTMISPTLTTWTYNITYTGSGTLKNVYIYLVDSPSVDINKLMPRIIAEVKQGWAYSGEMHVKGTLIVRIIVGDYDETFTS